MTSASYRRYQESKAGQCGRVKRWGAGWLLQREGLGGPDSGDPGARSVEAAWRAA